MQIFNLTGRTGRPVANQFAIICKDGTRYFRSYNSNICRVEADGTITVDSYYWNYNKTTSKYLAQFLETNIYQIRANVEAKIYKMEDLNGTETYNKMYNL